MKGVSVDKLEVFINDLDVVIKEIRDGLIDKNRKYGDSILSPVKVFAKGSTKDLINSRLDDKISRMISAQPDDEEGISELKRDIMGYLLIDKIFDKREKELQNAAINRS